MTGDSSFDQKKQPVQNQTNIANAEQVIVQSSSSATPLVPQQIRRLPPDFKGRGDEIRDIIEKVNSGATVIGVRGLGGIGKTALALVLGNMLKDRFPDGQLFLNMQGMSKSPLKPEDAMAHIIRSYRGTDVTLPLDFNGLAGLYNSVLSEKKSLILLDNVSGRDQIEPLLPPAGSVLFVTSRDKFALTGLKETDLGVLPLEDSKRLLLEIADRIGKHAEDLANLCGCLPLALRNAAYALKERRNISVGDYLERLKDARKRLDLVEASFSLSYDLLTPELQKLWCLLSVFPADFDLAGAAVVWEMESVSAEEALGELMKWSLVDFLPSASCKGGRYRLHDLSRVFVASRLDTSACNYAQQRHAEHYRNRFSLANRIFIQGKENYLEGLQLFDQERANISAGQYWAEKNQNVDSFANELCRAYAVVGSSVIDLRFNPSKKISWFKTGLEAARRSRDKAGEGTLLGNLGSAHYQLGEMRKAIEYCEQALNIAREIRDPRSEGGLLGNLGNAYSQLGETCKAIEHHEQALNIAREIGDVRGKGAALGNLGNTYSHLGETQKSIECFEQALKIVHEIGDRRGEGGLLGNLGLAYSYLGETRKAINNYVQALKIAREIGDMRGEGAALGNLGNAYSDLGETRKGIEYYEQALKIACVIEDRRIEGAILDCLGLAYADLGEPHWAIKYYEQALKIAREIGNCRGEGTCMGNLGLAYYHMGEMSTAMNNYEQALKIAREIGDRRGEENWIGSSGLAYYHLGEPVKAIKYYEQAAKIAREIGNLRGEGTWLFNISLALEELDQRARAIELAKSALEILKQIDSPNAEQVRQQLAEWKK